MGVDYGSTILHKGSEGVTDIYLLAAAGGAAFLLNIVITYLLIKLSHHREWYDVMDHRKIHNGDIPRIGGIGFFASALIVWLAAWLLKLELGTAQQPELPFLAWALFIAAMGAIHFIGILDDFSNISPRFKLFGQIAVAALMIGLGFTFQDLYLPFVHKTISLGWGGPVLTFIWIVGISNAVNLLDGLDGLAGTFNLFALAFLGSFSLLYGSALAALFTFALCGALLAFLLFNLPPAKIFMGDSGSLLLGFFLAAIPLLPSTAASGGKVLPFAVSLALVPIYDTLAAIIRRSLKGKAFYRPDSEHIHHKLLKLGLSDRSILVVVAVITLSLGIPAYIWVLSGVEWLAELLLAMWIVYGLVFVTIARRTREAQRSTKIEE